MKALLKNMTESLWIFFGLMLFGYFYTEITGRELSQPQEKP
jgi:hypothetical protein